MASMRQQARPWAVRLRLLLAACCAGLLAGVAMAQAEPPASAPVSSLQTQRSLDAWLARLQQASSIPAFVGTYVVTTASGAMASARIWHACEGDVQLERVDVLTGPRRSSFRRNDVVSLLLPEARTIRVEQRESGGRFPNLLGAGGGDAMARHYRLDALGQARVAGLEADLAQLDPVDGLRYGYRIWSERETGLVLKMQIFDAAGKVLEQSAFSDLQLNPAMAQVKEQLAMTGVQGYRTEPVERVRTDAAREGWQIDPPVPGFEPQACYRRAMPGTAPVLQWVFSDGLASISMFIEPFDARPGRRTGQSELGATRALVRRWPGPEGAWWVTLVGEVPEQTLNLLFERLRRKD